MVFLCVFAVSSPRNAKVRKFLYFKLNNFFLKIIHETDKMPMQPWFSALRLMRIPFSIYLMPVFWFAASIAGVTDWIQLLEVFVVLHLFVYPASNGYNSFYDKDEGSIGGLKLPPKVTRELYILVILFDLAGLILSWLISPVFFAGILIYTLISKAYSWPGIRLKKMPVISTVVVTLFQGCFTFLTVQSGLGRSFDFLFTIPNLSYAFSATLFLLGSYPLTQIYQHHEDSKRGDKTLSLILGIEGTFIFSRVVLGLAGIYFALMLFLDDKLIEILVFILGVIPVLVYFERWYASSMSSRNLVDYEHTMTLNKISSLAMSLIFILHLLLQVFR